MLDLHVTKILQLEPFVKELRKQPIAVPLVPIPLVAKLFWQTHVGRICSCAYRRGLLGAGQQLSASLLYSVARPRRIVFKPRYVFNT
jgi:hypothetical protein